MNTRSQVLLLVTLLCATLLLVSSLFLTSGFFKSQRVSATQSSIRVSSTSSSQSSRLPLKMPFLGNSAALQAPIRVMALGDSITYGTGSSTHTGYRVKLWTRCMMSSWNVAYVGSLVGGPDNLSVWEHEGHPGWRIDQISEHIVVWLKEYRPQVILLHIGTNDILQNHYVTSAPTRLRILLNQITTTLPQAIVIVAQITPLGQPELNTEVVSYNDAIPSLVQEEQTAGRYVESVDMYDPMPLRDLPDKIHPNDDGYTVMASVWYEALQPLFTKSS